MSCWPVALVLLGVWLAGPLAFAAEEGADAHAHGPDWFLLGLQVLNVVILGGLLVRFTRKPLADYLKQRSLGVRQQIESAERTLGDVEQELAVLRQRLDGIDDEKAEFVAEARQNAHSEAERHLERANETSVRIQEDARRVANQEIARARMELQSEAAMLATSLAGEILREKLTPEDDRRLVAEFIERVGDDS